MKYNFDEVVKSIRRCGNTWLWECPICGWYLNERADYEGQEEPRNNTYNLTLKHYCTLFDLMFEIDWELSSNLFSKSENYSYSLKRFEKVSEEEYNIVLRKVEK